MDTLGELIHRRRKERRMPLQEVADLAGISKAHVWELERGRTCNPSIGTLVALGRALDLRPVELFEAAIQ